MQVKNLDLGVFENPSTAYNTVYIARNLCTEARLAHEPEEVL